MPLLIDSLTHFLSGLFVDAELDFPVGALTQLPADLEPAKNMSDMREGIIKGVNESNQFILRRGH